MKQIPETKKLTLTVPEGRNIGEALGELFGCRPVEDLPEDGWVTVVKDGKRVVRR